MEGEVSKSKAVNRSIKIIDRYAINVQRGLNCYYDFFQGIEYNAWLKDNPTKLLTCIMIQKARMERLMKMNRRNEWGNLSSSQLERRCVDRLKQFIKSVAGLDHEYILKMIEVLTTTKNMYIILQRYVTLADYVQSKSRQKCPLKERQVFDLSEGLVSALSYISSKHVASGRLNLHYLVIHNNKVKMNFLCFIKYFNIEDLSSNLCLKLIGYYRHFFYFPKRFQSGFVSKKCDIWSLALILYYLLTFQLPFQSQLDMRIPRHFERGIQKVISGTGEMFRPLVQRMLVFSEKDRANIDQIQQFFILYSNKEDHRKTTVQNSSGNRQKMDIM